MFKKLFAKLKMGKFHLLLIISIITVLLLLSYVYKQYSENATLTTQLTAVTDTVTLYKTKAGKNAATISILQGTRKQLLAVAKVKNKEIYNLIQQTKGLRSVTVLKTETRIDTIAKVDTMFVRVGEKTNTVDSILITKQINNPYYNANIRVVNDSLSLGLKVKNDFDITHKDVSNGLFKGTTYKIDVVNRNPYTFTSGLSTYEIKPKVKVLPKILLIAVGVAGGILIAR